MSPALQHPSRRAGHAALALALLLGAGAAGTGANAQAPTATARPDEGSTQRWDFEVRLDGKPIGTHRFVVRGGPAAREVESNARFDVKLLGLNAYRYRHEARERWQGDCLRELHARTDDDGTPTQVDQQHGDGPDCLMSFAYWHPALSRQSRLLNPQTGRIENVRFERLPEAAITSGGREVQALRWRLITPEQQIVIWRDPDTQRWLGLDAKVSGNRQLSYRLP